MDGRYHWVKDQLDIDNKSVFSLTKLHNLDQGLNTSNSTIYIVSTAFPYSY
jgi:hypothetical protein